MTSGLYHGLHVMGLVVGLNGIGDTGRRDVSHGTILTLPLRNAPIEESLDGPVTNVDAPRLVTPLMK